VPEACRAPLAKVMGLEGGRKYGDSSWAIASVLIDSKVDQCAKEIKNRWIQNLEGVDIWGSQPLPTALVQAMD
jgi:hypothetical protein